jgi:hypothetical protein
MSVLPGSRDDLGRIRRFLRKLCRNLGMGYANEDEIQRSRDRDPHRRK